MALPTHSTEPAPDARLRSGTAARLAGLPVTTLRVWERRYGVVAAPKTVTGQRLYSQHDVQRLRLLRQLTLGGHAIGTIAALEVDALQALAAGAPAPAIGMAMSTCSAVVVGRSAARKLRAVAGCALRAVHDSLDHAETAAAAAVSGVEPEPVDLLLVHLSSLQPASARRVQALADTLHADTTVVLYAFGAEAIAESLRAAGVTVRREPVTGRDLAQLLAGPGAAPAPPAAAAAAAAGWPVAARRFSDEALADLAERPSPLACECLRHVAEIVAQLAGFERYSDDCVSRTPADAALHRDLSGMAGAARTLFEQALERVLADEQGSA